MPQREENNYPKAIAISSGIMISLLVISFFMVIGKFEPEQLGTGGMVVNYGTAETGIGEDYMSVEEPSVDPNANNKKPDEVVPEQKITENTSNQSTDKEIQTQNTEDALAVNTKPQKTKTATPTPNTEDKKATPTVNQNALYKGKKKDGTGGGDGTGGEPGNQGSINGDPLTPFYGDGGSGYGNKPLPLSKFSNLVPPVDDGQRTGKIMVKIQVNKQGKIISATAGVRGTTFSDADLFRKCERTMLASSLNSIENGPDIRIFYVPFVFKVK